MRSENKPKKERKVWKHETPHERDPFPPLKIKESFFILVLAMICALAMSGYCFYALVGLAVMRGG